MKHGRVTGSIEDYAAAEDFRSRLYANNFASVHVLAARARDTAMVMMVSLEEEAKTVMSPALPRFTCHPCSAFDGDI